MSKKKNGAVKPKINRQQLILKQAQEFYQFMNAL